MGVCGTDDVVEVMQPTTGAGRLENGAECHFEVLQFVFQVIEMSVLLTWLMMTSLLAT